MFYIVFYFLVIILLIYIISALIEVNETFNQDFDKILDNKCKIMSSNTLNNYLGIWDQQKGVCGEYRCPLEQCTFTEVDRSISIKYGEENYKFTTENSEKTMTETDNTISCTSKHETLHPNHGTEYKCDSIKVNDIDHGQVDFCYEFDGNNWNKNNFIKLLDRNGFYTWRNVVSGQITSKTDQEITECRKEPYSCSLSNNYCCKLPGHPDPCHSRPINSSDQEIIYIIDPGDPTGKRCITGDVCGVETCYNEQIYRKDCWQYNRFNREWTNDIFSKKYVNGNCEHVNSKNVIFDPDIFYNEPNPICQRDQPEFTNETCAINNAPITCKFLDKDENIYEKTYQSKLHFNTERCVYETETSDDILDNRLYIDSVRGVNYPSRLNDNDLCPEITPADCINSEHFIKLNPSASPKCSECPAGTYRNDESLVFNESEACSDNTICPTITECIERGDSKCKECLKRLDGNKFEIVQLELQSNKDSCDVLDDSICEKKLDKTYVTCSDVKIIGSKKYCDNCNPGYGLTLSNNEIICKKIIECFGYNRECLDSNLLYFDEYMYDNDTDEFSPCIWRENDYPSNTLETCKTSCEGDKYKTTINNSGGVSYCSSVFERL